MSKVCDPQGPRGDGSKYRLQGHAAATGVRAPCGDGSRRARHIFPGKLPPPTAKRPHLEFFVTADVGLIVPIGDTGNRISLDLGFASAQRANEGLYSLSLADSQR